MEQPPTAVIDKDIRSGRSSVSTAIYADIVFCGDRSGSMKTMGDSVFKGLIELIWFVFVINLEKSFTFAHVLKIIL